MVARGVRTGAPPTPTDLVTSIHIPVRSTSRPRNGSPAKTIDRHTSMSPAKRLQLQPAPPTTSTTTPFQSRYGSPLTARRTGSTPRSGIRSESRYEQREHPPDVVGEHLHHTYISSHNHHHHHQSNLYTSTTINQSRIEDTYGEPSCDYDSGATVLYELLESSSWEKARSRCRSHPEEVRTWIVRKDRSLQVRWKLLPLHAAIIFQAPNFIVSALLEKFPAAASRKDDQGMLPLHLAFRHKQDDEDLLEILLAQYPMAVMIKDRRDRVPLEHGRDSKFSAKLMRLFADASVAASRGTNNVSTTSGSPSRYEHGNPSAARSSVPSTPQISTAAHEHQISRIEAEYEGKMAILKAELTSEYENKIKSIREDNDVEIKKLKDAHNERLLALVDEKKKAIDEVRMETSQERQRLVDQHKDELNELRDLLTSQVRKDRMMRDALESEVSGLHNDLNDARKDMEYRQNRFIRLKSHVLEVHNLLTTLCEDQVELQDLLQQQQDEIDAAKAVRQDLLSTLLDNENNDSDRSRLRTSKMTELASKLKHKCERVLERNDDWTTSSSHMQEPGRVESARTSSETEKANHDNVSKQKLKDPTGREHPSYRLEEARELMTRSAQYEASIARDIRRVDPFPVVEGQEITREDTYLVERVEQAHDLTVESPYQVEETRDAVYPSEQPEEGVEITSEGFNEEYGQTRAYDRKILADEISAITENSDF